MTGPRVREPAEFGIDFEWVDDIPSPQLYRVGDSPWIEPLKKLIERPGQWARIGTFKEDRPCKSTQGNLKASTIPNAQAEGILPPGCFRVSVRKNELYGRYEPVES